MGRAARIILALLLWAAPALTLASQAGLGEGQACAAREAASSCPCQAGAEAGGQGGCGCPAGEPCQVNSAPVSATGESLPSQVRQPHPPAPAAQRPGEALVAWSPLVFEADEAPWRPPKPLYLRHLSLLI